ncbi:hypothetical protein KR018_001705, partial [Drosophila ironensis]
AKVAQSILNLIFIVASAWPIDEISLRIPGVTGWYVPQVDGELQWVTKFEGERLVEYYEAQDSQENRLSTNAVNFYLYTRKNPSTGQQIKATEASIDASDFNPNNPTRITIHGWNSNYKDGVNTRIADAWFQYGDYNMIAVDWARGRSLEYASSVAAVSGAGQKVAALVDFLVTYKQMRLDTLEVVGFSLGAHVAGYTGKHLTTGRLGKLVGLDPASPLMSYSKPEKRLSSDDAVYVESIHTNGAVLGFKQPIGFASFYPNGGKTQPGCGLDATGSCSHTRSVLYYVESLLWNNFPSKKCNTYQLANKNQCGDQYSSIQMGASVNVFVAEGIFYVPVNKESPYGFGEKQDGGEQTTDAPEISTTTAAPEDEETTNVSEEETTAAPGGESTTPAPGGEETTPGSGGEETTAAPGGEETTAAPGGEETTTGSEEETTAAPGGEETTAAPGSEETTAAPGGEETTDGSGEETTAAPGSEETTPAPGSEETTAAPGGEETTDSSGEETTPAPGSGETTDASGEETTSAPGSGETTDGSGEETTAAPGSGETTDGSGEETTAAPGSGETTDETTDGSGEETTPGSEETTAAPGDEDTTQGSEEVDTTPAPEETSQAPEESGEDTTPEPDVNTPATTTTTEEPEISTTTPFPDEPSTDSPDDDKKPGSSSKNVFMLNLFLVNVKVEK